MEFTCIMCPVGCTLNVTKQGENIIVKGNGCPRGEIYGKNEITLPKRMITTIKKYKGATISLKTSEAIDKTLINNVLKEIDKVEEPKKINIGDILIKNIFNTNVDIIVTNINYENN
ncbi:MAG: DUF1667 domain-containing protein [Clostridia bacterium]|nr:DUF1667 domain-containing protein [Clostridia bacterium]